MEIRSAFDEYHFSVAILAQVISAQVISALVHIDLLVRVASSLCSVLLTWIDC